MIGWLAVIASLFFLTGLLTLFLLSIKGVPKKKAQEASILMRQAPGTANGYNTAPQLEASAPQEPPATTVFDAAEYGDPPEANDAESASDGAEAFIPSSSEIQSVEEAVPVQESETNTQDDEIPLAIDFNTSVWAAVSEQSRRGSDGNASGRGVNMEVHNGPSLDAPGSPKHSDDHSALLTERARSTTETAQKESLEATRIQDDRVKQGQLGQERENMKNERIEQECVEQEQMKQEQIEKQRLKQDRLKQERINQERLRLQQLQQQQIRQQRLQQQQAQKQEECVMS